MEVFAATRPSLPSGISVSKEMGISRLDYAARVAKLLSEVETLAKLPLTSDTRSLDHLRLGKPLADVKADEEGRQELLAFRRDYRFQRDGRRALGTPLGGAPGLRVRMKADLHRFEIGEAAMGGTGSWVKLKATGDEAAAVESLLSLSPANSPNETPLSLSRSISLAEDDDFFGLSVMEAQSEAEVSQRTAPSPV